MPETGASNSQAVVATGASPAVAANVNIENLAKIPFELPYGMLSRYFTSRIDLQAASLSHNIFSAFRLPLNGHKNVETALSSLKAIRFGRLLEIGFGVSDVVHTMAKLEGGEVCLAICAALKECYSDEIAVEVVYELARLCIPNTDIIPSRTQWKTLLDASAGILSGTDFPHMVEHFTRLQSHSRGLRKGKEVVCSSPKSIAEVLLRLAAISRGDLISVDIVGGPDAGWAIAVAEWLLDLKVSITQGNELLYTNHDFLQKDTQVCLDYGSHQSENHNVRSRELRYVSSTVYMDNAEELFFQNEWPEELAQVSGRIQWGSALKTVFGQPFQTLMGNEYRLLFAELISSASLIFEAVSAEEKEDSRTGLVTNSAAGMSPMSYGQGLITTILSWFPELEALRTDVEDFYTIARKDSFEGQCSRYTRCVKDMASRCLCAASATKVLRGERNKTHEVCPLKIALNVIVLSRILAYVSLENTMLLPTRRGFELIYEAQFPQDAFDYKEITTDKDSLHQVMFLDHVSKRDHYWDTMVWHYTLWNRLNDVSTIFTGRTLNGDAGSTRLNPTNSDRRKIAQCSPAGLCLFSGILCDRTFINGDLVGRIHVIPGRIYFQNKSYTILKDKRIRESTLGQSGNYTGVVAAIARKRDLDWQRKLRISESPVSSTLQCLFEYRCDLREGEKAVAMGPAELVERVAFRKHNSNSVCNCVHTAQGVNDTGEIAQMQELMEGEQFTYQSGYGCFKADGYTLHYLRCQEASAVGGVLASLFLHQPHPVPDPPKEKPYLSVQLEKISPKCSGCYARADTWRKYIAKAKTSMNKDTCIVGVDSTE